MCTPPGCRLCDLDTQWSIRLTFLLGTFSATSPFWATYSCCSFFFLFYERRRLTKRGTGLYIECFKWLRFQEAKYWLDGTSKCVTYTVLLPFCNCFPEPNHIRKLKMRSSSSCYCSRKDSPSVSIYTTGIKREFHDLPKNTLTP